MIMMMDWLVCYVGCGNHHQFLLCRYFYCFFTTEKVVLVLFRGLTRLVCWTSCLGSSKVTGVIFDDISVVNPGLSSSVFSSDAFCSWLSVWGIVFDPNIHGH
jgi:hypothetical protein